MKRLGKKSLILVIFLLFILGIIIFLVLHKNTTSTITSDMSETDVATTTEDFAEENQDIETEEQDIVQEETEPKISQETTISDKEQTQATTSKNSSSASKEVAKSTNAKTSTQSTTKQTTSTKSTTQTTQSSTAPSTSATQSTQTATSTTTSSVKKITQAEIEAEKAKYLSDIKSIAPGLNYVYSKRGQVFWPYRTREITTYTNNISFGTIYYFVETFVESGQEKFKYYIDWAG